MQINLRRSQWLRLLIVGTFLLCLSALAVTALQLAERWPLPWVALMAMLGCAALAFSTRQSLASPLLDCHTLELLGQGRYRPWLVGQRQATDCTLQRWQAVGPMLLLEFAGAGRCRRILLCQDQCDAESWRALRATIIWQQGAATD